MSNPTNYNYTYNGYYTNSDYSDDLFLALFNGKGPGGAPGDYILINYNNTVSLYKYTIYVADNNSFTQILENNFLYYEVRTYQDGEQSSNRILYINNNTVTDIDSFDINNITFNGKYTDESYRFIKILF